MLNIEDEMIEDFMYVVVRTLSIPKTRINSLHVNYHYMR